MEYNEPDSMLNLVTDINRRNFQFLTRISHGLQDRQFFLIKNKNYPRSEAGIAVVADLANFYNDKSLLDYWKGILNFWDCPNRLYAVSGNEESYLRAIHFRHFIILSNYWDVIDGEDGYARYLYAIIKYDWSFTELTQAILKYGNNFNEFPYYHEIADILNSGWVSREVKNISVNLTI